MEGFWGFLYYLGTVETASYDAHSKNIITTETIECNLDAYSE